MREALVPPNPKELDKQKLIFLSIEKFGTRLKLFASSALLSRFIVGGITIVLE